jgi:uroporphyrinogen decarboxylase
MNSRDRFNASLRFQPIDRPFRWESLGMWPETLDRWYSEGLDLSLKQPQPGDWGALESDQFERVLVHAFAFDRIDYLGQAVLSGYTDTPFCPSFEVQVLSEDGQTRLLRDRDGILKRELTVYNTSSMPQFLRFPVETRQDFLNLLPRLDPDTPERLSPRWRQLCSAYAQRDFPAGLTICGAFGHPRNLLGVEALCTAYYDQPELIHEILEHWLDFYTRLAARAWRDLQFDFVLIWEDMAYRGGSLISPRLFRRFMLPVYRRLVDFLHSLAPQPPQLAPPVVIVDSDGDVSELVPLFLEAGVEAVLPFEVQAGMDVRQFRQKYGNNLAIIGGLDKRLLVEAGVGLQAEIAARVPPLLAGGGYIPSLDHTVPPDVSLANFRRYLQLLRVYSDNPDFQGASSS